jgi:DNA-binding HxlR family transcriptional regulator
MAKAKGKAPAERPGKRSAPARQTGYGQFCPVALASEVLTQRWTPLVVRELICGSHRFNELQRGVPRMSPSLLSRRLRELQAAGIVERRRGDGGSEYHLTAAGRELFPVLEGMGVWAQRWLRHDLVSARNLDPDLLMWDVRRNVVATATPDARRFVAEFMFPDMPAARRRYWLVFDHGNVDLCYRDPGFDIDLQVVGPLRTLTEIWLGHVAIEKALRDGRFQLEGDRAQRAAFVAWFALSKFAPAGRAPPGRNGDATPHQRPASQGDAA